MTGNPAAPKVYPNTKRKWDSRVLVRWILVLSLVTGVHERLSATPVEIEGTTKYEHYLPNGELRLNGLGEYWFSAYIDGKRYQIRTLKTKGLRTNEPPESIIGTDSVDYFSLIQSGPAAMSRVGLGKRYDSEANPSAIVRLAFESSSGEPTAIPALFLSDMIPADRTDMKVKAVLSGSDMPRHIEIHSQGAYVKRSSRNQTVKYKEPYGSGFLSAEYIVTATTNILSSELPIRFEYRSYELLPGTEQTIGPFLAWKLSFAVTNLSPAVSGLQVLPTFTNEVIVQDSRFAKEMNERKLIQYKVTNAVWLARGDPRLKNLIARGKVVSSITSGRIPERIRTMFVVLLLILLILPITSVIRKMYRNPKHSNH